MSRLPKAWQPFVVAPAVIMCKEPLCILAADPGCSGQCRFHWAEALLDRYAVRPADVQDAVHDAGTHIAHERAARAVGYYLGPEEVRFV